jgi:hypothetical protein
MSEAEANIKKAQISRVFTPFSCSDRKIYIFAEKSP